MMIAEEIPDEVNFTTSKALGLLFGMTEDEAEGFQTRLEYLSGNVPHLVVDNTDTAT